MKSKGFLLMSALFIISIIMLLSGSLAGLLISNLNRNSAQLNQLQSFYLAEAGIEMAKAQLISSEAWFTDSAHYPSDDVAWIETGAVGTTESWDEGAFKIIKEKDKNIIYALGKSREGRSFIKAKYENQPFRLISYSFL